MKNLLLTFTFLFSFLSYAQKLEIDKNRGVYTMSGVSAIEGVSKRQIFDEIYRFLALNYTDIDNVIIQTRGDTYSIYALAMLNVNWFMGNVKYKIFIEIKDGKFRYTFTNFKFNDNHFEQKNFIGRELAIEKTEFDLGNTIIKIENLCRKPDNW